jgi:hypothetical protein
LISSICRRSHVFCVLKCCAWCIRFIVKARSTTQQEYDSVPNAACRLACLGSAAWAAALAVADIVEGKLLLSHSRCSMLNHSNRPPFFCRDSRDAGKDLQAVPSVMPSLEIDYWRRNHVKLPFCSCFSGCQ